MRQSRLRIIRREAKDPPRHCSEGSFWKKLRSFAATAGKSLVEKVLILYYSATDPATPAKARAIAWSALGYFILPPDLIPDFTPGVGYSDDLSVVALALGVIAAHIKPRHKTAAQAKLRDWFDPDVTTRPHASAHSNAGGGSRETLPTSD